MVNDDYLWYVSMENGSMSKKEEEHRTEERILTLIFFGWIIQWFGAIWSPILKGELFLSGGLCLFFAMVITEVRKDRKKGEKK